MNTCPNCNSPVSDGTNFCPSCGATMPTERPYVQQNDPYAQPSAGSMQPQYVSNPSYRAPVQDNVNVGLCILSVLFPLFGIIYFFCVKNNKPREAKACLKSGLISAGVTIVFSIILTVVTVLGVFGIVDKVMDAEGTIEWSENDNFDEDNDIVFDIDDNEKTENQDDNKPETKPTSKPSNKGPEQNETVNSSEPTTNTVSANWKQYAISIGGKSYSLPISYSDFSAKTGYTFKSEDDAKSTLKNNYFNVVTLTNGSQKIHVEILNNTGKMITQEDGLIISFNSYNSDKADNIIYPGNLKAGMEISRDEIISMFGAPDDEYKSDGDYYAMKWFEDYDKYYSANKFTITLYGGKITDIGMDRGVF